MINLGNICLIITLISAASAVYSGFPSNIARRSVFLQFCLLSIALLKLINSHINTDLSFSNVLNNSHHMIPALYKITGVWANHEGSMLLLTWIFSLVNIVFMYRSNPSSKVLSIQSLILLLLLSFLIFTCNPFLKSTALFPEGRGFNPLLQDIALSIHPPILYAGYAGLSIPFSIVVSERGKSNITILHRWILYPWVLLTIGIGLGGWWAYRELGWGGFWFWDPVENISLIVWLLATASLHSINVSERAGSINKSTIVLSIFAFLSVILGIFLVRSGILNSVHSFAFDSRRGVFLFGIFLFLCLISLYGLRALPQRNLKISLPINLNIWYLIILALIIILGILYPFFHEVIYKKAISVDEQFYERTLSIVFIPLLITLIIYSFTKTLVLIFSVALFVLLNLYCPIPTILHKAYVFLGISAVISTLLQWILKRNSVRLSMMFGHLGLSVLVLGGALYYSFKTDQNFMLQQNQEVRVAGYKVILRGIAYSKKDNYLFRQANLEIWNNSKIIGRIAPQIRFYPIEKSYTYESGVLHTFSGDIYTTIGAIDDTGKISLNIQYKPFIYLIWLSLVLMGIGGVLGGRRYFPGSPSLRSRMTEFKL